MDANRIKGSAPPAPAEAPAARTPVGWGTGEVLEALVLERRPNSVLLRVGALRAEARTSLPLQAGQRLALQVVRSGTVPVLRALDAAAASATSAAVERALRTALPRQDGYPPLLVRLESAARTLPQGALGHATEQALRRVLDALPRREQVATGDGLRLALLHSGAFLEHRLFAEGAAALGGDRGADLGAALLRLAAALKAGMPPPSSAAGEPRDAAPRPPLPPLLSDAPQPQARPASPAGLDDLPGFLRGLLHHAEAAVARLQLHQLANLDSADAKAPQWLLELPVRTAEGADLFHLAIREEETHSAAANGDAAWQVELAFDLEGLGPIQARVRLAGGTVSVGFHAEQPATLHLLEARLEHFGAMLREQGLEVGRLDCGPGGVRGSARQRGQPLVDEQA